MFQECIPYVQSPLFQYTQSTLNEENYENVLSYFKNIKKFQNVLQNKMSNLGI